MSNLVIQAPNHPDYATPLQNPDGTTNPPWWRFWAALPNQDTIICTQATFPTLNNYIAGRLIYVADYGHTIYWDGQTAEFADGGNGFRVQASRLPASIGWHACDGSTQNVLNADGSVTATVLPTAAGYYFRL